MEIYSLILDDHKSRFSSTEKIFMLMMYRRMSDENVTSMYFSLFKLSEEMFVSRIIINRALQVAEELGLIEKQVCYIEGSKKVRITIKRGF